MAGKQGHKKGLKKMLARQTDGMFMDPPEWPKVILDGFASTNPSRH